VQRRHGCRVLCHVESVPMVSEKDFFERHGFPLQVEPVVPDGLLAEGRGQDLLGLPTDVLDVPGHCPGSLCFHLPAQSTLIGGDVLFRGGIGRWDLPGGNREILLQGVREKILPLPGETTVLPGHGPATTVAEEQASNPFLRV
jgi:hydroxyacylglutathione hydrolase